jgi:hypothetical protein
MNGLRVYMNLAVPEPLAAEQVFYSRRSSGPFYKWRYEKLLGRWLSSRMLTFELSNSEVVLAPWKRVPEALKSRLNEHYLE